MRDLIKYILFALVVVTLSCKKKEGASEPQNTGYAANLTPQEQSLVGRWILDSVARYDNTAWISSYRPSNTSLKLQGSSSIDGCMSSDTAYSYYSYERLVMKGQWSAKRNNLIFFSVIQAGSSAFTNTIVSLTTSSLVLKVPGNSGQAPGLFYLNYYHK